MRNFGLIGKSLVHSFSKDYFNKKFKEENIDALYSNFELDNISNLKELFSDYKLSGLNVTIPFKQKVISQLDSLDFNVCHFPLILIILSFNSRIW